MDEEIAQLTAVAAAVGAAAIAYAKAFGPTQHQLVEWIIAAGGVASRWRGLLNLAVGLALALLYSALAALYAGAWTLLGLGVVAGVFASVEAARTHDARDQAGPTARPPPHRDEADIPYRDEADIPF